MAVKNNADKPDPEQYNRLVAHATLRDIRLIGSKFDVQPDAIETIQQKWRFRVSHELDDWSCDNDRGALSGSYVYTASCVLGRRKLLTVVGRYLSTYRLSDVCDEEAGRQFLERIGRFSAYPYFRSMFATLTQQSGIMLPPLPIISDQPRWVTPPVSSAVPEA